MTGYQQILINLKTQILEIIPGADIILFGSRANNTANDESDWDLLILVNDKTDTRKLKKQIQEKIFPLSVAIGSFINILLVSKADWFQNPSYYSIRKTVAQNNLPL